MTAGLVPWLFRTSTNCSGALDWEQLVRRLLSLHKASIDLQRLRDPLKDFISSIVVQTPTRSSLPVLSAGILRTV